MSPLCKACGRPAWRSPSMAPLTTVLSPGHRLLTPRSKQADSSRAAENLSPAVFTLLHHLQINIASACRCSSCAAWLQSDFNVSYLVRLVAEQHLMQHNWKARAAVVHGPETCMDCGDCCLDVVSGEDGSSVEVRAGERGGRQQGP